MTRRVGRRTFIGTAAAAGTGLLAGCGVLGVDTLGTADSPEATVDRYLDETDNYDGTIEDLTGNESVSVDVGAEGNGGHFAYAPPAIRVDSGTTVTWVWTGEGNAHNVFGENDAFESEQTAEEGYEFEHTFEEPGTYLYCCTPHLKFATYSEHAMTRGGSVERAGVGPVTAVGGSS